MAKELRVVLLGKTGSGKSSLGNTLLGREGFRVARGLSSGTEKCQWADTDRKGAHLQVTDTPGICDTHRTEEDILNEIAKSVAVSSPGPHVVLMVLRCDTRFTWEEYKAYKTLKGLFGDEIRKYMIVVFCGADKLGKTSAEQQSALKAEIRKDNPELSEVISDSGDRFFAVNNKGSQQAREEQADALVIMIQDLTRKNGGSYFSNRMCQEVSREVDMLIKRKREKSHASQADAERQTKQEIVEEQAGSGFMSKIKEIVINGIAAIEAVVKVIKSVKDLKDLCSVM